MDNIMVTAKEVRERTNKFRNEVEFAQFPSLEQVLEHIAYTADNGISQQFISANVDIQVLDTLRGLGFQYTIHYKEGYIEISW
jgi:hypothetical protein